MAIQSQSRGTALDAGSQESRLPSAGVRAGMAVPTCPFLGPSPSPSCPVGSPSVSFILHVLSGLGCSLPVLWCVGSAVSCPHPPLQGHPGLSQKREAHSPGPGVCEYREWWPQWN